MADVFLRLLPIFFFFSIGVVLRRFGLAERSHGDFVLRLAFFVTLPLLILLAVSSVELDREKAVLPVANIVVNFLCLGAALLATKPLALPRATLGSMLLNTMIVNNAFMFPFMLALYGDSGFADAVLYDFGNAIMVATITFATAFRYSDEPYNKLTMLKRIVKGPIFWALAVGVTLSTTGVKLPAIVVDVTNPVAQMTAPLILIALGIFFSVSAKSLRLVALAIFIRMGLGFAFGLAFALLLGLDGQLFAVVVLCSAAPIGFMALTFTSMAKLDMELTTNAVSLSILLGLVYVPLLVLLIR